MSLNLGLENMNIQREKALMALVFEGCSMSDVFDA